MNGKQLGWLLFGTVVSGCATYTLCKERERKGNHVPEIVPEELRVGWRESGIFLGCPASGNDQNQFYVGRRMNDEGHVMYIGPPHCGKTTGPVKGSILKWSGSQVVVVVKGPLVDFAKDAARKSGRSIKIISLSDKTTSDFYYDPFFAVTHDPQNLAGHMWDISLALLPDDSFANNTDGKLWIDSARSYLTGVFDWRI